MTSSKYIQLSDKILMEYEYFNISEATSAEIKEYQRKYNGTVYSNVKNNLRYFVNNDFCKIMQNDFTTDNSYYCQYANNVYISRNDNNRNIITAEDYMNNSEEYYIYEEGSSSGNGGASYNKIKCDKVKIYFTSSYNIESDKEYAISIYSNCLNCKCVYASFMLNDFKNIPTPFLIGEKLYTKMIEFYVPSMDYIENIKNIFGIDIHSKPTINISLSKIFKEDYAYNSSKFQTLIETASTSIATNDQYSTVYAKIEEIDDYFVLEGCTKNTWKTFSDFIADLPGTVNDYILMHDITVNELVMEDSYDNYNWKVTTHNIITQTDDFDEPVLFRPILKYDNCIGCVIDYTLRIYCQLNNTQIIKRSTFQNFNFAKYGKKMIKINLGLVPPQVNVYNKLDNDLSTINIVNYNNGINIQQDKIFKTTYITSFKDRLNVKASIAPVKIENV